MHSRWPEPPSWASQQELVLPGREGVLPAARPDSRVLVNPPTGAAPRLLMAPFLPQAVGAGGAVLGPEVFSVQEVHSALHRF